MKVFISWSGEPSKKVAEALRGWIPHVIQTVTPWMSGVDIAAGARWGKDVGKELEASQFGILCVTPGNTEAPWLLFEAGVMAKSWEDARVCPYLHGLSAGDVPKGPLTQFQAKLANREDTRALLMAINQADGKELLPGKALESAFDKWWPDLEKALTGIAPNPQEAPSKRGIDEKLDEVVDGVRQLLRSRRSEPDAADVSQMLATLSRAVRYNSSPRIDPDDGRPRSKAGRMVVSYGQDGYPVFHVHGEGDPEPLPLPVEDHTQERAED